MSKENLIRHYNEKYQSDKGCLSLPTFKYTKYPADRHEACLKFFIENFNGNSILELGAGNGALLNSFINYNLKFRSYKVSDFSEARLMAITNNIKDNRVKSLLGDVEDISSNNHKTKYDAIIMNALIEHLIDPIRVLLNLKYMLNEDGFMYVETPNLAKFSRRLRLLFGQFPSTASKNEGLTTYRNKPVDLYDEGHLHYFTFRSLSLLLLRCGFTRIKKVPNYTGPRIFGKSGSHLLAKFYPELFSDLVVIAYR